MLPLGRVPYPDNSAPRIGPARDQVGVDNPRFRGLGQFSRYILPLWKQSQSAFFQQRNCVADQLVERRERAGGHDIESLRRGGDKILDSLGVDNGWHR